MAALFAEDVRHLVAVVGGIDELFGKGRVEIRDDLVPVHVSVLDAVQLILHFGGKSDVHDVGKILDEKVGDLESDLGGHHELALFGHILALCEHGMMDA